MKQFLYQVKVVVGISMIRFVYQVMIGCRYINDTVLASGYGWL